MRLLPTFFFVCCLFLGCSNELPKNQISQSDGKISPRLIVPIKFKDFTVNDITEGLDALFDAKISIGEGKGQSYEFMRLKFDDPDSYLITETANQYLDARNRGAMPMTTYDITMSSWFNGVVPVLVFLKECKYSNMSFMVDDLMDLSVSFLPWVGSEEREQIESDSASGLTLRNYFKKELITEVPRESDFEIGFKMQNRYELVVTEHARGDYDGDGYEDSLITVAKVYLEGSGRDYSAYLVSRTSHKLPMKIDLFLLPKKSDANR